MTLQQCTLLLVFEWGGDAFGLKNGIIPAICYHEGAERFIWNERQPGPSQLKHEKASVDKTGLLTLS